MRSPLALAVALVVCASVQAANLTLGDDDSTYNPSSALGSMYLSAIAYCDSSTISAGTCGPCQQVSGFSLVSYMQDPTTGATGYIATINGNVFLVFRGSDDIQDWIQDLKVAVTVPIDACSGCEVHLGFNEDYKALRPQIMSVLSGLDTSAGITISGHSLGAAIAVLAAFDLSNNYTITSMYTFGEPRVGNPAFAAAYAAAMPNAFRVVHYADVVPHLPLEDMGFQHAPTEVWYQEDNVNYQVCSNSDGEDASCSDGLLAPISIADHLDYLNYKLSESC